MWFVRPTLGNVLKRFNFDGNPVLARKMRQFVSPLVVDEYLTPETLAALPEDALRAARVGL